jgi:uncharacterized membrane protein YjfL (UPF0719 family)
MARKIAWVVSLALLLVTGLLGIYSGVTEWNPDNNPVQKSVTAGVLLYGVLGFVTAYGLFLRRRWSFPTAIAWGVVVTYVPGVAVMSFSDEAGRLTSAFAASGTTALIAAGVIWTTYLMTRPGTESASPTQ